MKITEVEERVRPPSWKAGGIPFFIEAAKKGLMGSKPAQTWICLVTSTDPAYNGPDPCIPKGRADFNETPEQGGLREIQEETGIDSSHVAKYWLLDKENVTGLTRSYDFYVLAVQLKDKAPIRGSREGTPHWYTAEQAMKVIRDIHRPFLQKLLGQIQQTG